MKTGNIETKRRYFRGVLFIIFCVIFFVWSKQFNAFYTTKSFDIQSDTGTLTVLFANMYKNNTSYEPIQELIVENNPDMLMFVEFAPHHYQQLESFLKKHYPYTNNISRSKMFVGSMVFSKYPITNKAHEFPQGAWRYGYFSIPYQGQHIYFYVVHTSSPDKYQHFLMRNEQLKTFVKDFTLHESKRSHKHIVVAGDFNITPWSRYYTILSDAFSGQLNNITSRIPFLFSRRLKELPLFQAHIDHIRTSDSLNISDLRILTIPGSDHKGFLFTIKTD